MGRQQQLRDQAIGRSAAGAAATEGALRGLTRDAASSDYFGQTVNIAARVLAMADAQEICVTGEVWVYPGVQTLLEPYPTEQSTADFRGVGRSMAVVRVGVVDSSVDRRS